MAFVAFRLLALAALATQFATATPAPAPELVTVVNPNGPGPQETFSASIVGVDKSNGRTTYAVAANDVEGSSTVALGTATLVAGSDYESFTISFSDASLAITEGFDFTIQSGNAIATGLDDSSRPITTSIPTASVGGLVLDLPPTGAPGGPRPTNSAQRTAVGFGALVGLGVAWQLV
ncbi:hypothetical protein FB451DRAFT_1371323 [Mycena latifolia]|nr:hypothetical protein FB451DRAFT_1371323 [Mycena latifolia]